MRHVDVTTIGSISHDTYIMSSRVHIMRSEKKEKIKQREVHFPFGTKIELDHLQQEVGGGASNAATTFHLFDFRTSVISQCGDDPSGEFIIKGLQAMQVDTENIQVIKKGESAQSIIFLDAQGERTVFVYRGVASHFSDHHVKKVANCESKWLYVTSVGGYVPLLRSIIKAREARGVNIAWNPGGAEFAMPRSVMKNMLQAVDVLFINNDEARLLFGTTPLSRAKKLVSGALVVTKGERGAEIFIGNKHISITVKPVKAKDTTGAGDAFGSGFISGLMHYPGDFQKAGIIGSANAMSEVLEVGAKQGLLGPKTISRFAHRIKIH